MIPVEAVTLRIRLLFVSAIQTSPKVSTATPAGLFSIAFVAELPSPVEPKDPEVPVDST